MIASSKKPRIAVVGYGKVGGVLTRAFIKAGYPLAGVVVSHWNEDLFPDGERLPVTDTITNIPAATDFVVLCVRDHQIPGLVEEIVSRGGFKPGTVVAHTAGAVSAKVLEPVRTVDALPLAWHPMQTFVGGEEPGLLEGVTFGLDGDSEAVEFGMKLTADLGGMSFIVPPDNRPLYHLAAVLACNMMAGLAGMAIHLLRDAGMSEVQGMRALGTLMTRTAQNLAHRGLPESISGPHRRGDIETIKSHLDILDNYPNESVIYRLLSLELIERLDEVDNMDELIRMLEE